MFFRQAEPSGVWWRHQLEGGRKTSSMGPRENGRCENVSALNQVMSHEQGKRSAVTLSSFFSFFQYVMKS